MSDVGCWLKPLAAHEAANIQNPTSVFSFHSQLGLELPVSGLFEIELQPLQAVALGIVRARSAFAQTSPQHQGGVGIIRLAGQGGAKAFRRRLELAALP